MKIEVMKVPLWDGYKHFDEILEMMNINPRNISLRKKIGGMLIDAGVRKTKQRPAKWYWKEAPSDYWKEV